MDENNLKQNRKSLEIKLYSLRSRKQASLTQLQEQFNNPI